jgi:hypothetical protein
MSWTAAEADATRMPGLTITAFVAAFSGETEQ